MEQESIKNSYFLLNSTVKKNGITNYDDTCHLSPQLDFRELGVGIGFCGKSEGMYSI